MNVLVLNAGSSTIKCALFHMKELSVEPQSPLWRGSIDWSKGEANGRDRHEAVEKLLASAWSGDAKVLNGPQDIAMVGHRVVHGGEQFSKPTRINSTVKQAIKDLSPLAPLHNPANLQGIEMLEQLLPGIPQVAVFDTAYHRTISEEAATYAGPYDWREWGIRRYGFHGISHEYCAKRAGHIISKELSSLKVVTCHLGNGCSLASTREGRCVDTTMGFTPMEGMMMGTRCGSIDPGILLYFLRNEKMDPEKLDLLLNFQSGLKGICGDSDMRLILARRNQKDQRAELAFSMFVHHLKRCIGWMTASMDGVDVLVFTAGIGESASEVRKETCQGLSHLGISLDLQKNINSTADRDISGKGSKVKILVIHTREEWSIAEKTLKILGTPAPYGGDISE